MIPLTSKSRSSKRSDFLEVIDHVIFLYNCSAEGLVEGASYYPVLHLKPCFLKHVSKPNYPIPSAPRPSWAMLPAALGHSQFAATREFPSHCTPNRSSPLCPCHLQVLSNALLSFSSALLYSVQMRGCLQLLQSSSVSLAARNRASGIPCTGSYAGNRGVTSLREKGSRAQREGAQVQISTPRLR